MKIISKAYDNQRRRSFKGDVDQTGVKEQMTRSGVGAIAALVLAPGVAHAQVAACGGALLGSAAFIACTHAVPDAPQQLCTFSWTLQTDAGLHTFQGYFDLLPGQANRMVFQTAGISAQIGGAVVQCQDALWDRRAPQAR